MRVPLKVTKDRRDGSKRLPKRRSRRESIRVSDLIVLRRYQGLQANLDEEDSILAGFLGFI